jgi:deoxycytidine triphosphate deaminase
MVEIEIPENGLILSPSVGYLGNSAEWTETYNLFPYIDGRSSMGRNFTLVHFTAGRGDDGVRGQWTLEINCVYPTLIRKGMRSGQIYYEQFVGERKPYNENVSSHYDGQRGPTAAAAVQVESIGR